jgi:hypothetical protein
MMKCDKQRDVNENDINSPDDMGQASRATSGDDSASGLEG